MINSLLLEESAAKQLESMQLTVADFAAVTEKKPEVTTSGKTRFIKVQGALTRTASAWQQLFGATTTYSGIVEAVTAAEKDSSVSEVVLAINSPGGGWDGLFQAIDKIKACKKPRRAVVSGMCASAAYAIACACDSITATCEADMIGSIGVLYTGHKDPNAVRITSSDAPEKAPDVSTSEGVAVIQKQLDMMHSLFTSAICEGRKVSEETVKNSFGHGGLLLARDAVKCGMIDLLEKEQLMDFNEAKSAFSAEIALLVGDAVKVERERVLTHLEEAKESGGWDLAAEAISKGEQFGASHGKAHGKLAAMNAMQSVRVESNVELTLAANPVALTQEAETLSEEEQAKQAIAIMEGRI